MRRIGAALGAAVVAACLACTSGSSSPAQPTQPAQPPQPASACVVQQWACSPNGYGSFAYSPSTGAYAWVTNQSTQAEAESTAISYCKGADCATLVSFHNACGAIASAPSGQSAGGTGGTANDAGAAAVAACEAK